MALPDKFHMCTTNKASSFTLTSSRTVDSDYPITNLQSQQSGKFAAFDMTAQTALNIYGTNATAWDINCLSLHNHNLTNGTWRVRLYSDAAQGGALLYDSASDCYALLDGSNDSGTTSDTATNSITGDLTCIFRIAPTDITPAGAVPIFAKYVSTGNQRSFYVYLITSSGTGRLGIESSPDGSSVVFVTSTVSLSSLGISDGSTWWGKLSYDVDNGAAGRTVTFSYSVQDVDNLADVTWTQYDQQTAAGTTSIYDSTAVASVGTTTGLGVYAGKIFRAVLYSDLTATTVVADFDPRRWTSGTTFGSPVSGETWTLNNGASIVVTAETVDYPYATTNNWKSNLSKWFDSVSAKSFQIDVTVSSTINNTILIDKLFLGEAWTLTYNAQYGSSVVMEDKSIHHQKPDGGVMTVEYPASRKAMLDFSMIDDAERVAVRDYLRTAKKSNDVLVTLDPNNTNSTQEDWTSIYRVDSSQQLMPNFYNNHPLKIALVEN